MSEQREMTLVWTYQILRKNWQKIVVFSAGVLVLAYLFALTMEPIFEASADLMVKESKIQPEAIDMREGDVKLYEAVIQNDTVLQNMRVHFGLNPDKYRLRRLWKMVTVSAQRGRPLLRLSVRYRDPEKAAEMANYLADQAVDKNLSIATTETAQARNLLIEQRMSAAQRMSESRTELHRFRVESSLSILEAEMAVALDQARELDRRIYEIDVLRANLYQNPIDATLELRREEMVRYASESGLSGLESEIGVTLDEMAHLDKRLQDVEVRLSILENTGVGKTLEEKRTELAELRTRFQLDARQMQMARLLEEVARIEGDIIRTERELAVRENHPMEQNLGEARNRLALFNAENQIPSLQEQMNLTLKEVVDLEARLNQINRKIALFGVSGAPETFEAKRTARRLFRSEAGLLALNQEVDNLLKEKSEIELGLLRVETEIVVQRQTLDTVNEELATRSEIRITANSILHHPELMGAPSARDRRGLVDYSLQVESETVNPVYVALEQNQAQARIALHSSIRRREDLRERLKENTDRLVQKQRLLAELQSVAEELDLEFQLAQGEYVSLVDTSLPSYLAEREVVLQKMAETRKLYTELYDSFLVKQASQESLRMDLEMVSDEFRKSYALSTQTLKAQLETAQVKKAAYLDRYAVEFDAYTRDAANLAALELEMGLTEQEYRSLLTLSPESLRVEREQILEKRRELQERYRTLFTQLATRTAELENLQMEYDLTRNEYRRLNVNSLGTYEVERTIASGKRAELLAHYRATYQTFTERSLQLEQIQLEYDLRRQAYRLIQQNLDEINYTVSSKWKDLIVLNDAVVPERRVGPKRIPLALSAAFAALLLSCGYFISREYFATVAAA